MQGMFDIFVDAGFLFINKTIDYLLEHGVNVYQYILTYEREFSFLHVFGLAPRGVCHTDDLIYMWDTVDLARVSFR